MRIHPKKYQPYHLYTRTNRITWIKQTDWALKRCRNGKQKNKRRWWLFSSFFKFYDIKIKEMFLLHIDTNTSSEKEMCLEPENGKPWWIRRVYMYQGTGVFNNATDCSIFKQSDISICWPSTWLWAPAFILASADFVEHTSVSSVNEMNCRKLAARERGIFCDGAVRGDNCAYLLMLEHPQTLTQAAEGRTGGGFQQ